MGAERKGLKSGGYVGGFLQLFDWNAKSRKKLFSSKSDLPEQCKQKKTCDGNLPMTRIDMMEEDETVSGSIVNGGSDYSCASSVTDEDLYGTRPPSVVARLMGLDSLPTSNYAEAYSTPFSDTQSLRDFRYRSGNLKSHHDQIPFSGNLCDKIEAPVKNIIEPQHQKPISKPIEKFQTEVLPPKSAKSIPITQHKLLSPIKSSNFIPSKDAAQIMEVAARILDPGPQVTAKSKISIDGSSSVPLKLRDLKEKVQAAQKPSRLAEASRRPGESTAAKYLKGQSMNKSWNGSADATPVRVSSDSEECSASMRKKGKSISLALQAKANVQKREGLNLSGGRNVVSRKEPSEVMSNQLFKSRSSTQKSAGKKSSAQGASNVLRQNNQKQNRSADIGKSPSKQIVTNSQGRKGSGEFSFAQQRSSTKTAGNCKVGSRRLGSDVNKDKREGSYSSTKNPTRKKRCIDSDFQFKKTLAADNMSVEKGGQVIQSDSKMDRQISLPEHSKSNTTDIVSFTFNAPMTRPTPVSETSREAGGSSADYRSKQLLLSPDGSQNSNLSSLSKSVLGGDALNTLLEQKLRELTHAVEASQQKPGAAGPSASIFPHVMAGLSNTTTSITLQSNRSQDLMHTKGLVSQWAAGISSTDFQGLAMKHRHHEMEGIMYNYDSNDTTAGQMLDHQLPSPISVLEPSLFTESCNSSDVANGYSAGGGKLCLSVQAREVPGTTSLKRLYPVGADAELSDSASSTCTKTVARKHVTASCVVNFGQSTKWELEYVKEILCNVELMFKDFAMGRARDIINPHLFEQLEGRKGISRAHGHEPKLRRKVLFDCVSECLNLRCRQYAGGGCEAWAKGLSVVRRKERLAEEVYNEISRWSGMGNCMVDELVDKDMNSQCGRWLDFECEACELGLQIENRLINSLIDEVVADILVL